MVFTVLGALVPGAESALQRSLSQQSTLPSLPPAFLQSSTAAAIFMFLGQVAFVAKFLVKRIFPLVKSTAGSVRSHIIQRLYYRTIPVAVCKT